MSPSPQGSSPAQAYITFHPREALISFKALTGKTQEWSKKNMVLDQNPGFFFEFKRNTFAGIMRPIEFKELVRR
jgi:hypothetical protein